MKKYFTILFILLVVSFSVFAQKTHKFKGTVKNQNGEIIAGANLYFEKDGQTNVVSTDINGDFKTELSVGEYNITVNKELSKSFNVSLIMQKKGKNPKTFDLTVETNFVSDNKYPKPVKLPYPVYPAAAQAIRAAGEVVVSLKVNKDGQVISAKAKSGHPLLRQTSEKSAMNSIFEKSENSEEREVILTYTFILPWKIKEDKTLKRFSNLYRIEVISIIEPIDTYKSY